ncbi:MAG: PAS domain S-box protein [Candidatus Omnitrophota bacterium]
MEDNTREELMKELAELRQHIAGLERNETEHRKVEEALRISEANYRAIFDAANDAIFVHDIETGEIVDANRKVAEMYCYSPDEIKALDVGRISSGEPPYSQGDAIKWISKASRGEPQLFEWLAKDKAGRLFWVEVNLKSAVIGGRYRILAVVRDITERKRAEERLEKINNVFLNFSVDPTDNINRLTSICGELLNADCALYNHLEGDMLSSCGQWHVPPDFRSKDKADGHICYDIIRQGSGEVAIIRNLHETAYNKTDPNIARYGLKTYMGCGVKFGSNYIGSLCVLYKYDFNPTEDDKNILKLIAAAIGVEEERKDAEEVLQLAQFSIERAGDSIFWIGPDADILYVNDMACRSLGYSREELLLMKVSDINPNFPPEAWPKHWKELKERKTFNFESRQRRKDGTTFPVEITVNYLEFQGDEYNFAFSRDITERKRSEENLLKRDYQLEVLSRTSQHINTVLDVQVIMRTLVAAAMELVSGTAGAGGLLKDGKMVFTEYNTGGKPQSVDYVFEAGHGVPGWVANTMKPYICNDAEHDAQVPAEIQKKFGLYNLVSVPIINGKGELLGCFEIYNKEDKQAFDAQDVFMMQGLAASSAVAIENAKMLVGQKKIEEALRESEAQYRTMTDSMADFIHVVDKDLRILVFNRAFKRWNKELGLETSVIGRGLFEIYPFLSDNVRDEYRKVFETGKMLVTEELNKVTGKDIITETRKIPIFEGDSVVRVVTVIRDITDNRMAEKEKEILSEAILKSSKRLKQLALKDPQTGLYNHRYISEVIESEFYRARKYVHPLSVVMIDIDYFKSINDMYGHNFGDMVLVQLARQIKKMVRRYDVVVRYGGEEFLIMSPGTDRSKAIVLAQRLIDELSIFSFGNNKHTVKLKLSIAVASYPEDNTVKGVDLINIADFILDKAKEDGGNRVYSSLEVEERKNHMPEETADVKSLKKKLERLTKSGKQSLIESISAFAKTIELKDHYTGEHTEKTVYYATEIAKAIHIPKEEIEPIRQASILHDLGKIGISEKILLKKAKLTKKELEMIRKHPQIGVDILRPIHFMHDIIPLILYHHERWDGKGYPAGLKGEEIPIGARIIAIADVYQALTSDRPYRKAFPEAKALKMIKDGSGTQFDPDIVKAFLKILKYKK